MLSTYFVVVRDSLFILPCDFMFVNMFFHFFENFSCSIKSKRRRGDLNPRAAVNDLHPFQGCPFGQLGYFSRLCPNPIRYHLSVDWQKKAVCIANWFLWSGEGGIRTHAPLRTNGFQDRLVMTTSIPLRVAVLAFSEYYNTIQSVICQYIIWYFSKKFSQSPDPQVSWP